MVTYIVFLCLLLGGFRDNVRRTDTPHQQVWSGKGLRVYRLELLPEQRSALHHHDGATLIIPLTDGEVLEYDADKHEVNWSLENANRLRDPGWRHAISNPGKTRSIQLEIEFEPTQDRVMTPRFHDGVGSQEFLFPTFKLRKFTVKGGASLAGDRQCQGAAISLSRGAFRDLHSLEPRVVEPGEAISSPREQPINASSWAVSVLFVCSSETPRPQHKELAEGR
jgi:hypothetical protein